MPKSTKDETTFENSIAALATEDEPKSEKEIISQTPNNLTKREQLELEYDKRDSEENKAQSDRKSRVDSSLKKFSQIFAN